MSEGDEQFHRKRFKGKKRLEIPEKALARGVDSCRKHFVEKKKKEEASPQGKNRAMGRGS